MNARGERILIFGDSLSHHGGDGEPEIWDVDQSSNRVSSQPGDLLGSLLLEQGATAVRIDANVGRSAWNFWQGNASHQYHSAQDLITSDQMLSPTKLVVMLGTNDLGMDMEKDAEAMRAIVNSFPGAEAWAIGPPIFANDTLNTQANDVYAMLKSVFGDRVIDARPLSTTVDRAGDGIHFQPTSAAAFASALAEKLLSTNPAGLLKAVLIGAIGVVSLIGFGMWWSHRESKIAQLASAEYPDEGLEDAGLGVDMLQIIASESKSPEEFARRAEAWSSSEANPPGDKELALAYDGAPTQQLVKLINLARSKRINGTQARIKSYIGQRDDDIDE